MILKVFRKPCFGRNHLSMTIGKKKMPRNHKKACKLQHCMRFSDGSAPTHEKIIRTLELKRAKISYEGYSLEYAPGASKTLGFKSSLKNFNLKRRRFKVERKNVMWITKFWTADDGIKFHQKSLFNR
jgi:hypothetical protein